MSEAVTIGELARAGVLEFGDGYRTRKDQLDEAGFRILRAADVRDGYAHLDGDDFVAIEHAAKIGGKAAREGDVVLTTKGTVGRVAMVPALGEAVVYSPQLCYFRVRATEVLDARFLRYWLRSPQFQQQSSYLQGNTDMAPYISLRDLASTRMLLPTVAEQRRRGKLLGALDDKIQANRKLAATAALLVSGVYDWALGLPGRRRGRFFDFFSVEYGTAYKGGYFSDPGSGRPLIRVRDLKTYVPQTWTTEVVSGEATVQPGDILVGMDADFSPSAWQGEVALLNQRVCRVSTNYSRAFTLEAVRAPLKHIESYKTGTTVIHLNKRDLTDTIVELPSHEAAYAFDDRASALLEVQTAVLSENRALRVLRDTLLPKLMSGELRVAEAAELVGS